MTDARSRLVVETAERFADGGVLMDAWIDISDAGHQAFRQSERVADAAKSRVIREGAEGWLEGCLNEARCHAACAARYVGHYPYATTDLPGNPKTVSAAVTNAISYERGIELGVTLRYSGEENAGPMRAARNVEKTKQIPLIHCIFGNPFCPACIDSAWLTWNDGTVVSIAEAIYTDRAFDRLPILADALEDAGCDNRDILEHCRLPGVHVRGCWVVDLVLGKE